MLNRSTKLFSSKVLTCSLQSRWRAASFVASMALIGIVLSVQFARTAVAAHWGKSTKWVVVGRAAALDPVNAEYQFRLGLLREFDWEHMDLMEAVRYLKKANTLQPNRADYWSSLGHACFTIGDDDCANQAYETSIRLAPGVPRYQWEIANYHLLAGRREEALSHFSRLLELSPSDASPVFNICQRFVIDPDLIWRKVLPRGDAALKLAYVDFLNESGDSEAAFQYWNRIARDSSQIRFSAVKPYLDGLIVRNQIDQALTVWRDLESLGVIPKPEISSPENIIFNGGFDEDPMNSGFDWRTVAQNYIALDFTNKDCDDSKRCLRMEFTVANNEEYEPIYEIVPIQPLRQYQLSAFVRSVEISSDSGPRLRVVDPQCPACLSVESPASVGTTPWHEVFLSFSTGPKTQVVHVSVWRPRGRSFPMEIQGTFWLSSVSLRAASATEVRQDNQSR